MVNNMQKTIKKLEKKIDDKADWKFVCSSLDKKAGKGLISTPTNTFRY
jgi:hypothetical protein